MIDRFRLGFANRTLGYRLPAKNRAAGAEMRGRVAAARHPARERARALQRFAGDPGLRRGGRRGGDVRAEDHAESARRDAAHLYLPGAHRGVWNEEALVASKEIILCEALIDALTFWCAGYPQRDGQLRRERLHRRSQGGLREARHGAGLHRLRPRRGRETERRQKLAEELMADGHRVLPGAVSEGHGRQRIRAEGAASGEGLGVLLNKARVAGQGRAARARMRGANGRARA